MSRSLFAAVALAALIGGCVESADSEFLLVSAPDTTVSVSLGAVLAASPASPQALVAAPAQLEVVVGEELDFAVTLAEPEAFSVRAAQLPEAATAEALADGARVLWTPSSPDIGEHHLVFLVVDADDPALVIAQTAVDVTVLPAFRLIEYGF
jgi:hypothetical protein